MSRPHPPRSPDDLSLREAVQALKHDLGKYVAWRSVNLPEDAWTGAVGDAWLACMRADVLATRTSAAGDRAAWEVFEAHTAGLAPPWPPELEAVQRAVACLQRAHPALDSGDRETLAAMRTDLRAAQLEIRAQLAALHRRLLGGG